MIARLWRGRAADADKADAYVRHFTETVTTELKGLAGHRGAWLLRREADADKADAYVRHFTGTVTTELKGLSGHRGAWLLRREADGGMELIALTLWESRQSIEAFTGPDISKSVVEPAARAVLQEFDDFASHYEVVFKTP